MDASHIDPQATFAARGIGLQIIASVAIDPRNTTLPDPRQSQRAHLRPQSIEIPTPRESEPTVRTVCQC